MKKFLKEGLDWEKIQESMNKDKDGYQVKTVPTWAKAKSHIRKEGTSCVCSNGLDESRWMSAVDPAELLSRMSTSGKGDDYGRFLLTDEDDLPAGQI